MPQELVDPAVVHIGNISSNVFYSNKKNTDTISSDRILLTKVKWGQSFSTKKHSAICRNLFNVLQFSCLTLMDEK